jgi:hypothetical protein
MAGVRPRMLGSVMNCFCFGGRGMSLPAFMSSLTLSAQRWGTPVVLMHHREMKKSEPAELVSRY